MPVSSEAATAAGIGNQSEGASTTRWSPRLMWVTRNKLTGSLFVAAVDWCANVQVKRNIEAPPTGGLFLGNENPFADLFDPADKAKGWLTAFDAETGKVRWKYPAPHPMFGWRHADSRWVGIRCGSRRPDLRHGRRDRKTALANERRAIHRWWHCHLSRRRTTAHRRGFRNEVTDVAGRRPAEPHSRVRFALTDARASKVNDVPF